MHREEPSQENGKRAGELIDRLNSVYERAAKGLGMEFVMNNYAKLIQPTLDEIDREIKNHLHHPQIDLPQLKHALGVEEIVRFPSEITKQLEEKIEGVERQIDILMRESKN